MNVPTFVYPFTSWWTFELFPDFFLFYFNKAAMNIHIQIFAKINLRNIKDLCKVELYKWGKQASYMTEEVVGNCHDLPQESFQFLVYGNNVKKYEMIINQKYQNKKLYRSTTPSFCQGTRALFRISPSHRHYGIKTRNRKSELMQLSWVWNLDPYLPAGYVTWTNFPTFWITVSLFVKWE